MKRLSPKMSALETSWGPVVDSLEARKLLSSVLSGGTVIVTGSSLADDIFVRRDASARIVVEENGAAKRFAGSSVLRISINGGSGDDFIEIATDITLPTTINGQDGWDTISGGGGRDSVFGGYGNDSILGNGGNDVIRGEYDADTVNGGAGNDVLYGHAGNDDLYGSSGSDSMYGSRIPKTPPAAPRATPSDNIATTVHTLPAASSRKPLRRSCPIELVTLHMFRKLIHKTTNIK